ncbi:MAG: NlpC/P60 family protein [Muribaculaceae bacterium]|nr:NlpC/P60 family protein [Muribaculaceae bacterium]
MRRRLSEYTVYYIIAATVAAMIFSGCHSTKPAQRPTAQGSTSSSGKVIEYRSDAVGMESDMAQRIEREARRWVGTRYSFGGASRKGTDCSGMVMTIFADVAGVKLPRNSAKQHEACSPLADKEMASGDLVFFTTSKDRGRINHVGIYIGEGNFVHASTSRGVIVSGLNEPYYRRHYHSARRVPGIAQGKKTEEQKAEKNAKKKAAKQPAITSKCRVRRLPASKAKLALPEGGIDLPYRLEVPYIEPFIPIEEEPDEDTDEERADIRSEVQRAMKF